MTSPHTESASRTSLLPREKLEALDARFYAGVKWQPKAGDYYTSSRADLELYRVVKIEDGKVFTEYCSQKTPLAEWPEAEFTTAGFGLCRVWVPPWVLREVPSPKAEHIESITAACPTCGHTTEYPANEALPDDLRLGDKS